MKTFLFMTRNDHQIIQKCQLICKQFIKWVLIIILYRYMSKSLSKEPKHITEIPLQTVRRLLIPTHQIEMPLRKSQVTKTSTFHDSSTFNPHPLLQTQHQEALSALDQQLSWKKSVSHSIASTQVVSFIKKKPPTYSTNNKNSILIKENYDIGDLTYTLIEGRMKIGLSGIFFFIFTLIRYYSLACCIYISRNSWHEEWIIPFILVRFIFLILVIKISISVAETRTQVILKTHWNSMTSDIQEYFEVVSAKKFVVSFLRGLIPPQLSFIYIRSKNLRKRYEIFTSINFIFASIEQVVFYPFFIIYCIVLTADNSFALNVYYDGATIFIASGGFLIYLYLVGYLLILGIRIKYGSVRGAINYKFRTQSVKTTNQNQLYFT